MTAIPPSAMMQELVPFSFASGATYLVSKDVQAELQHTTSVVDALVEKFAVQNELFESQNAEIERVNREIYRRNKKDEEITVHYIFCRCLYDLTEFVREMLKCAACAPRICANAIADSSYKVKAIVIIVLACGAVMGVMCLV